MNEAPTIAFTESGGDLFSAPEVRHLMRIEFDRAQRYRYPLICMIVSVDRLQYLQDLYGARTRSEILAAVGGVLTRSTRGSDLLGCLVDDRLLVVIPHATIEGATALSGRVLEAVRSMTFDSGGPMLRVTLSIGAADNQTREFESFETFVQTAETGVAVASAAGGDRFVPWNEVEEEVEELRTEVDAQLEAIRLAQERGPDDEAVEIELASLFAHTGVRSPQFLQLERDVLALVMQRLRETRYASGADGVDGQSRQVDILERRVAKLSGLLGLAEEELKRVARMKGLDLGIASIYRSVQGLAEEEADYEQKQKMMAEIFHANLEFQGKKD